MMLKTVCALLFACFASNLLAQVYMRPNGSDQTVIVTASVQPTGAGVEVAAGAAIYIANEFAVDIVVEIRARPTGAVVASVGVGDGDLFFEDHGLAPGTYDIWVFEAGNPPGQDCGDLVITP